MTSKPITTDKLWYLKRINLFKAMNAEEMMDLARRTAMKNYRKKEIIYLPGQPGQHIYLLKKGVVKISRLTPEGRELTLALLKPGEIFGELEVLGEKGGSTQAEAHSDVMICILNRNDLIGLMRSKPELGIRLSKIIGFRRQIIENRMENLIFRSVPQRLSSLFIELKDDFGEEQNGKLKINIPLTHEDVANLIGAARATVSETLTEFKNNGLIETSGKYFFIRDMESLKRNLA